MNLAGLRSRVQLKIGDLDGRKVDADFIDTLINEALRKIAYDTLILEGTDSSLTYSSANDGFALPSDFIRVKDLEWLTANNYYKRINPTDFESVRKQRNDYVLVSQNTVDEITPRAYAIHNGYIILDSTTSSSPTLYYYKYDTALSSDTDSPSFDSEWHVLLVDYAEWQLTGNLDAFNRWRLGLSEMVSSKRQVERIRSRYVDV